MIVESAFDKKFVDFKRENNAERQFNIAQKYFYGGEGEEDISLASEWYEEAAKRGHPEAQYMRGYILQAGLTGKVDYRKGHGYLKRAASGDNIQAILMLARNYYYGAGAQRKVGKAVKMWKKGAELGCPEAEYYLGLCYYKGDYVRKNDKKARSHFQNALKGGFIPAESALFEMGILN
ncbi:MAG: sel1 repeat family protein [Clostridia bacterium]|nr:sel1 repeat family protein [Clostridia bacterium]